MESRDFKQMFSDVAKDNGFEKAFEGWFKESDEIIHVLDLQKSNFGKFYYLNIKLFIQGIFGNVYEKSKKLVKTDVGNIFLRQPENYSCFLNLEEPLTDEDRKKGLQDLFNNFIVPLSINSSTKNGIRELHKKGALFVLPAAKKFLGIV